jgi:surface protein
MFSCCDKLTSLDLSSFDNTSNVTDMSDMFSLCSSLTSLDLSNFDTSNVTNMSNMFDSCDKLTSLNLSSFDTSNVIDNVNDMQYMFSDCDKLHKLHLDTCSKDTIKNIITSFGFPTGKVNGTTREIYCKKINAPDASLLPDGWKFEYVD